MSLLYLINGTTQPQTFGDCLKQSCDDCCYNHLLSVQYFPCVTKILRCQVMNLLWDRAPKDDDGYYIDKEE